MNKKLRLDHKSEYTSWAGMKDRCYNKNSRAYRDYGGRGIGVCERWRNSFEAFLADMGPRPPGNSIDRYPDNDGSYEPGNCRWATRQEQTLNKRARGKNRPLETVNVDVKGKELLTPIEVARLLRVDIRTVYNWLENKKLPSFRPGGRLWRITKKDFVHFTLDSVGQVRLL